MKYWLAVLIPLASLGLFACTDTPDYPAVGNGALANGTFSYVCVTEADAFCQGPAAPTPMPAAIAEGTTFRVAFTPAPNEDPATLGLLGNEQLTETSDGTFTAVHAGWASVFATNGNSLVEDYANVHIEVVDSLAILDVDAMSTFVVGDTRTISAQPLDSTGAKLAGSGTWDWESSDASIVAIDISDDDRTHGTATLRAVASGAARVRVVFGSATNAVDVLVGGA